MSDLQGLFNIFADIKITWYIHGVVQTNLYLLFDLQGLFNSVAEKKEHKYINSVV